MPSITDAVNWMIERANNPLVGYSQDFRCGQTLKREDAAGTFTYASNYLNDFTGDRYNATLTYYDCSSSIFYALEAGGWDVVTAHGTTYPWTTSDESGNFGDEITGLYNLGFYEVTGKSLKAGDIAWKSGHTAMVISDCDKSYVNIAEAYSRNTGGYVEFEKQFRESWRSDFTNFFRSDDGGSYTPVEINLYMVAAIAGNFVQESYLNPGVWESFVQCSWTTVHYYNDEGKGCGGYGLGQWTNTNGDNHGRLYQFYLWMTGKGYATGAGDGQVEYIFEEKTWNTQSTIGQQYNYGYTSFEDFVNTDSENLEELVHAWNACWEGIKDSSWDTRVEYAKTEYEFIKEHKDDESITKWYSTNSSLTQAQIDNNAVMLYRAIYNEFNDRGYHTDNDGGSIGNSGNPNTNTDSGETATFNDFLMAMLARGGSNNNISNMHINKPPKRGV